MTQQKGSQDPKEQVYSQLQFSTVKGHRLKSANRKDSWGKVQEKADTGFQEFQWSCMEMCLIFPVKICDNTCSMLSTREAHLILGVQGFYWVSVMQNPHVVMQCPNDWALLLRLQPSIVHLAKTNIHHKSVCQDKCIQSNWYTMAQGLSLIKSPIRHKYSVIRQDPVKGQF